ncbi:ABC transporter permease [Rhizobium sp. P32RR-XVIII]|uniref:ABC transporter permease n=1 Tax=Rhizobium sp. P32RR-XVIII TaxID=2726738 RepID=UPI0014564BAD|nr:ABC transporter permease [Rhizobium sp. P32RR-XVIII]NLS06935.1 ABC transporter permease [Rhizobium sp. P32RR-XVIII]
MAIADNAPVVVIETSYFDFIRRAIFSKPSTICATVVIALFSVIAIFAPWIAPYDPLKQSYFAISAYPSREYWLGTDQFGRDVLSRLIYGSRNSLIFGLLAPFFAALIGTTLGVVAGYFGGVTDRLVTRMIDLLMAFPELLLAIIISAALGGGFWNVLGVLTIAFVPGFARVSRASTLSIKQEPYIEAAKAIGVRTPVILVRHVLPNISAPIVLLLTLWIASAIRLEAALSFLGIGTQPPQASWGNIIRDGLSNVFGSPWSIIGAGLAITVVVLAFNVIGDSVRDALDPEAAE